MRPPLPDTRQRIELLANAYPRLFPRAELLRLVRAQLGHVEALDRWTVRDGCRTHARAPRLIHHICAGNLAVSAITSIAHGLLLGAHNTIQLPSPREESAARREIAAFVRGLPPGLRARVTLLTNRDEASLRRAEVVIAFGSDATMAVLRAVLRSDQLLIAHGHAVSLLWLGDPDRLSAREARACAIDVLTYDQLGCLSPQAIYFPPGANVKALGIRLARALEEAWQRQPMKPPRPLGVRARLAEARDVARALAHPIWAPRHLGWTVIADAGPVFVPSPLHGVIYLRACAPPNLRSHFAPVRGKISTVGLAAAGMETDGRKQFLELGATRFCRAGQMQFPPLAWHHDGRMALAELVRWIDDEAAV